MFDFAVRNQKILAFISVVLFSLLLISQKSRNKFIIARTLQHTILFPVQFVVNKTTKVKNIFVENDSLRAQNSRLVMENQRAAVWAEENNRLREMLKFKSQIKYKLIPAEVISHNPNPIINAFTVNAGFRNGVQRNMPVISIKGLAGKITEVYPFTSLVHLLNNPGCKVSVIICKKDIHGIMECNDGLNPFVKILKHHSVIPGDTVITSGLGGIYPQGLKVGYIENFDKTGDYLFNTAYVKFINDFTIIKELFILKKRDKWNSQAITE
ncbi:MAG: rod shape-determining protein MreC [bacterium]